MPSQFQVQLEELTEKLTRYIPKPMLPGVVVLAAIGVFFVLRPPHTICDTLKENLQQKQAGMLFPTKVGKKTYPGKIQGAMESCRFGDSSGACYEYFGILRRVAIILKEATPECIPEELSLSVTNYQRTDYYEIVRDGENERREFSEARYVSKPLLNVLQDGFEMMVRKAWGEAPPDPGPIRLGWFQESELSTFCHVQDVLKKAKGEGWPEYVKTVMAKLPGEKPASSVPGAAPSQPPRPATLLIPEPEIRQRSLFALGCASYR